MDELISVLVLWLSVTFALPQAPSHPEVRQIEPRQLAELRYGSSGLASGDDIMAVYHDRLRTIFLRKDWDPRSAADTSVLVHELVHHMQNVAGKRYACPAEREALAFAAQERWLKMFGEDLESAFGITAITLKLRTSCMLLP